MVPHRTGSIAYNLVLLLLIIVALTAPQPLLPRVVAQGSSSGTDSSSSAVDVSSTAAPSSSSTATSSTASASSSSTGTASSTCVTLPSTSVCANFFPSSSLVKLNAHACIEDAEAYLKTAPVVWQSLSILTASIPQSTCSRDFAQLMCFAVYRPGNCTTPALSREFCQKVLGVTNSTTGALITPGSCPPQIQQTFLAAVIPKFTLAFGCNVNPYYQPLPIGAPPPLVQDDPDVPIAVPRDQCQALSNTSICRGVIDYPIYLPWYISSQSVIEAQVAAQFASAMLIANVASGCLTSLAKMMCSLVYTKCDTTVLKTSLSPYVNLSSAIGQALPYLAIPFPQLPCQSLCQDVHDRCPELLESNPALANSLANCTGDGFVLKPTMTCGAISKDDQGVNFPDSNSTLGTLVLGGVLPVPIKSQCNAFNSLFATTVTAASVLTCPSPLVPAASSSDIHAVLGGSCSTPCPSVLFSREEWHDADIFFTIITVLSCVSSFFILLTWLVFPSKRRQQNTLFFNLCVFVLSFMNLIMVAYTHGKPSTISCKNDSEYWATKDSANLCVVQAIVFFYSSLSGAIFWLSSAIDLFLKVVYNKRRDLAQQTRLHRIYGVIGFGLPAILAVIAYGLEAFGGALATPWCFMGAKATNWREWLFFFYPLLLIMIIGCVCMITVMVKLIRDANVSGRQDGWIQTQLRIILFLGIFVFVFVFIFAYRARLFLQEDIYSDSATEWIACLIATLGSGDCGVKPRHSAEVGLWYMIQLVVGGQGFFNALVFGSQSTNFTLWLGLLTGHGTDWKGVESRGTQDGSQLDTQQSHNSVGGRAIRSGNKQAKVEMLERGNSHREARSPGGSRNGSHGPTSPSRAKTIIRTPHVVAIQHADVPERIDSPGSQSLSPVRGPSRMNLDDANSDPNTQMPPQQDNALLEHDLIYAPIPMASQQNDASAVSGNPYGNDDDDDDHDDDDDDVPPPPAPISPPLSSPEESTYHETAPSDE